MRILHIPQAYPPAMGGSEIHCQKISEALAKKSHLVRVLTANVGSVEGYYQLGISSISPETKVINGVEVRRLQFCGPLYVIGGQWISKVPWQWLSSRLAIRLLNFILGQFARDLQREICAFKPDLVMTMPHLAPNVWAVLKARIACPFPLVVLPLFHNDDPRMPPDSLKLILKSADAVITNTDYEATELNAQCNLPFEKIFTAWLGVDIPADSFETIRPLNVLYLGRKTMHKGIQDLLNAMLLVWKDYPEAQLILAGARTTDTKFIDRSVAQLPERYQQKVQSMDNISEKEKADLLKSVRCLVLPSRYESFGIVLLEAWAHKTPVITFDLPVYRSIISHHKDGLLATAGDTHALAKAISLLLSDSKLASKLGMAGRKKVEERFNWDNVTPRYLEAYEYAMASFRNKRRSNN